jgi:hypothetical protein
MTVKPVSMFVFETVTNRNFFIFLFSFIKINNKYVFKGVALEVSTVMLVKGKTTREL